MNGAATRDGPAVEIVGGGLSGLALGLAIRRAGVAATVYEAQRYPRHRVCGEFMTGLDDFTSARLHLAELVGGALSHRRVMWCRYGRPIRTQNLPRPALGLSRHTLDARLAEAFVAAGGDLRTDQRVVSHAAPPGRIFAIGRRRGPSPWLGLKVHARYLRLGADLELHLGRQAYVGLSAVEGGWINVCGLFRRGAAGPAFPAGAGPGLLMQHLRAAGLDDLAARLAAAEIDVDSFSAVAALDFRPAAPPADRIWLGDALAMTPPFTGNGMAMALQSAALAVDPLLEWARGRRSWPETLQTVNRRLWRRFRRRLVSAHLLHPFLFEAGRQRWLAWANRARLLPLNSLYRLTH